MCTLLEKEKDCGSTNSQSEQQEETSHNSVTTDEGETSTSITSGTTRTCEGEVIVIRPHLLGESAQGILLLNLREVEGQEEVLEIEDEE